MYNKFLLFLTALLLPVMLMAQVTTSSLTGVVVDEVQEPVPGATVVAVHTPSGTTYGTATRADGTYRISNMRVGGPYTVTFSFLGYQSQVVEEVFLTLGETYNLTGSIAESSFQLDEVLVSGQLDRTFNQERTGASTSIGAEGIARVPTISRSINDLTKLTPQSSGTSFAGRDNRFNSYTIDGSVYNNNFGLGASQFAGGNPVSLDAIEEIQINLAPYDVRMGGFTGASVNAVTRSGTNQYRGTGYFFYRNQDFLGTKIGDATINVDDSFTRTVGFSVGGPIIKNKLFFFVSAEQEEADNPGDSRLALRPGQTPDNTQISRVPLDQAQFVREQLRQLYGYDAGAFENIPFGNEALRLNARLDYNINRNHRAMLRFNQFDSFRDVNINGNSIRGFPARDRYRNTNRFGPEGLTFRNGNYSVDNVIQSIVAELNSTFGNSISNSFNIGYTSITDPKRSVPGDNNPFPMIEVLQPDENGQRLYYMTMGDELFTVGNLLDNNVFNVTNTTTYFAGQHTFTGGINFEYMTFANAFNPTWNSWYRFQTYDDFVAAVINRDPNVRPSHFAIGYTFDVDNPTKLPLDEVNFAQLGLFLQDEFQVNSNLKVTAGLRVDMPFYPIDAPRNPAVEALNLSIPNPRGGSTINPDVSSFPGINPLISPRLGFNWDVYGDRRTQVRGGTGVFSGRLPFVWVSNQINANGVMRGQRGLYANDWGVDGNPNWNGFQSDVNAYRPDPATLSATIPSQLNITADDFKLPQVWRSNIAVDHRLPFDIIGNLEIIYSQDYNSPLAVNLAHQPTGNVARIGGNEYPLYTSFIPGAEGTGLREVYYLTNINSGSYFSVTTGAEKTFDFGLFASAYYTRSVARDYGLIDGSQAQSLWPNVAQVDRNKPETGFSRFDTPNRIVAQLAYSTESLLQNFPTRVSLIYVGGDQGRYSYTYDGNFGDGTGVRLMYVPRDLADAQLIPIVDENGNVTRTVEQQWASLNAYIEQDDYLSNNRGEVTERNGALLPWLHRVDVRISQDVKVYGSNRIQLTFDVLNFGNLLNNEWGVSKAPITRTPVRYRGVDAQGNAQFTVNVNDGVESFRQNINISNTWSAQFGIRYLFN
jgi:hypothetical protein